ncbi:MAG: protein phosphatase 2C domain-containing protein [Polyangiaceae bacterium]
MTITAARNPTLPDIEVQVPPSYRVPTRLVAFAAGATDAGRVRRSNQDQFVIATLTGALQIEQSSFPQAVVRYGGPQGHLFAVADGMGGHGGGEQASVQAVGAVANFLLGTLGFLSRLSGDDASVESELKNVLRHANQVVTSRGDARPELHEMGTTLTVGYVIDSTLYLAHVGDSRCYLLRGDQLTQLTRDHTLVTELVEAGVIEKTDAKRHHLRHMITNAVGGGIDGVTPEVQKRALVAGDTLLFCSDGLTEVLDSKAITRILMTEAEPRGACTRLVHAAVDGGGPDNVTAIVVHFRAAHEPRA